MNGSCEAPHEFLKQLPEKHERKLFKEFMWCFTSGNDAREFYIENLEKQINAIKEAMCKLERKQIILESKLHMNEICE